MVNRVHTCSRTTITPRTLENTSHSDESSTTTELVTRRRKAERPQCGTQDRHGCSYIMTGFYLFPLWHLRREGQAPATIDNCCWQTPAPQSRRRKTAGEWQKEGIGRGLCGATDEEATKRFVIVIGDVYSILQYERSGHPVSGVIVPISWCVARLGRLTTQTRWPKFGKGSLHSGMAWQRKSVQILLTRNRTIRLQFIANKHSRRGRWGISDMRMYLAHGPRKSAA